jgi:hypothetical protein
MDIKNATERIEQKLEAMAQVLGEVVFDEWVLVHRSTDGWEILHYSGSRRDTFLQEFKNDVATLRGTLAPEGTQAGDFAFSHEGYGSGFDAFLCVGNQFFALFNNTKKSTGEITSSPKWTSAQVHFMELAETFITHPING